MDNLGKILIGLGLFIVLLGFIVIVANRFGIHPGRLPGDIVFRKGNTTIYFPIVTSILVSLFITLLLYLFRK